MEIYEVNVKWDTDKKGVLSSPGLDDKIEVVTPPGFSGGIVGKWTPEHLFVASVNSCLMITFFTIAENSKLEFVDFECNATGKADMVDGKYQLTEIILKPQLTIPSTQKEERAKHILEMSEKACLISAAINIKIQLIPTITVVQEEAVVSE